VRAGGTNILRQGNKLDRTVLLPEPWRKSTETIEEVFFFRYQSFMASQPYQPRIKALFLMWVPYMGAGWLVVNAELKFQS